MPDRLKVVWDDRFLDYAFGPDHPFSERSRQLAVHLMTATGLFNTPSSTLSSSVTPAPDSDLLRFHEARYVEFVRDADLRGAPGYFDGGDTPIFRGCFEASARIVGGTLAALDPILSGRASRAFNPAGGLHHAHPNRASGFCIFNDAAVAIARALNGPDRVRKVAYVDIDAHHGDGVMYGFFESGQVLDIDFHQDGRTLFPGTGGVSEVGRGDGSGLKVNLPLPPGAGDDWLLPLFRQVALPLLQDFRPELIILQHGMDGHEGDQLAQLGYSDRAYAALLAELLAFIDPDGPKRILVTGGGGYLARNVAIGLARAGWILGGVNAPPPVGLPMEWVNAFLQEAQEPAPESWEEATPGLAGSRATSEKLGKLVASLEGVLGRRFPGNGSQGP